MILIVPLRLMTWQNSHLRFTEALTFIVLPASQNCCWLTGFRIKTQKSKPSITHPYPSDAMDGHAGQTKLEYPSDFSAIAPRAVEFAIRAKTLNPENCLIKYHRTNEFSSAFWGKKRFFSQLSHKNPRNRPARHFSGRA